MLTFISKRLFYGFLVLLGVITLVFFLFTILPGDPARMMLGQRADQASIEIINKDLGLDRPAYQQFFAYLNDLSPISFHQYKNQNDFLYLDPEKYAPYYSIIKTKETSIILKKPYLRRSYQSKRKVSEILSDAFPKTALLALSSMMFAFVIGVSVGTVSALKKDSFFDKSALFLSVLGMSVPSFFAAILIAWFFAFVLGNLTGLNMFGTLYSVDDLGRGEYLELKNLILPTITLGIRPLAVIIEMTKSAMLDVLSQDYIRTAKSKGIGIGKIVWKHALKNAMNPIITSVSGWFASLMAGAVFVEYVFDWKGVGTVIIESLEKYDFPVVMGSLLFISVILVLINIVVDILYGIIDPRVRLK